MVETLEAREKENMMSNFRIVIAGDVCPTEDNHIWFEESQIDALIDDSIRDIILNSDLAICNLESVLTTSTRKIKKAGPALSSDPKCANAIKRMGFHYVSLSNNHIMDYGIPGVMDTLRALKERDISYSGVGINSKDASKPYYHTISGYRVGITPRQGRFSFCTAKVRWKDYHLRPSGGRPPRRGRN